MPLVADMNGDFRDGYCALPMSNTTERRASAAICYLDAAVRARPNLTIVARANVTKLLFDGQRATGVAATIDGQHHEFGAREIILCAGALYTPTMLLRAGIGPADDLRALGIAVRADLSRRRAQPAEPSGAVHRRASAARRAAAAKPAHLAGLVLPSLVRTCATVRRPTCSSICRASRRGMRWASRSPTSARCCGSRFRAAACRSSGEQHPLVEFNFVSDERDLQRLKLGFRWTAELLASEAMRALCGQPFPVRFTDRLRRLNQKTRANAWKASVVARLLNLSPALGDTGLRLLTGGARPLPDLIADDEQLTEHVRHNVAGTFHVSGTARMGARDDPDAVIDPQGRVHGIAGLRVADASVMPTVPRGNTNLPTIMIAEKLAAAMLAN